MAVRQSFQAAVRRSVIRFGFRFVQAIEKLIVRYSPHGDCAFFPVEDFAWAQHLEQNAGIIRRELEAILRHKEALPSFQEISPDQKRISRDHKWKTYFLYGYGYKSVANCRRCPETARLIEAVPGMKTAFFSILEPGKHIPAHRGPYKGVIRYHLGLMIPEPKERCRIRVRDEIRYWEPGKSLIFDDSHEHEVWNETPGLRAVLFLDVERPLRFPGSWLNKLILALIAHSPFVQDARKNQTAWEQRFEHIRVQSGTTQPAGL